MRFVQSILVTLFFILALISCKKDSSHAPHHCRIVAVYDTIYTSTGNGTSAIGISYDNNGRIAYENFREATDSSVRIFVYHDSTILVTSTSPRQPTADTVHLNSKGNPIMINFGERGYSLIEYTSYSYDGTGLLTSSTSGHNNSKTTTTYTYDNGDCVKTTSSNGEVINYTYFTDLTTRDGDPLAFQDIFGHGVPTIRNKHLVRSYQFGNFYAQYSYTFDNSGKIETVVYRCDTYVAARRYEYDCE